MKQMGYLLMILWSLWLSIDGLAQSTPPAQKMSVNDRMAKARAAKAEKNILKPMPALAPGQKATSADYEAPVVKTQKGPHGEVVHTGDKGGKFYINKNGNKTYLSSNQ
ncbi:hypothetical protein [Spirosoma pollinicola]|uniref:PBCV-specific basic adaptor domain-containing protein n=1 Tax=Spirosoma pollinicola TaxID=2057025 RepID=A0A2K8ZAG2_9BACT|nr:hypothetical protein [Spirosoma pollinicola]AUD06835.1 hypothetical protein CWM47_36290 [Spirosoma pollinicola]